MKSTIRKVLSFALLSLVLAAVAAPSMAGSAWQHSHGRRTQLNSRLNSQSGRMYNHLRNGHIGSTLSTRNSALRPARTAATSRSGSRRR